MNPKEIIESGILEEYVMGLLPEKESEEITRMCHLHPEIADEVRAIEHALNSSFSIPVNPEWKKEILSSLKNEPLSPSQNGGDKGKIISITSAEDKPQLKYSSRWFWAAASFAGLFILSAAANFMLLGKNQSLAQELTDTQVKLSKVTEEKTVFAASLKKSEADYQQLFNPDIARIEMKGTPAFPNKTSILYWNPKTGDVVWDGSTLPELNADQQYQLWAIVDGKPQNGGMLNGSAPAKMLQAFEAQAFAVTIEPKGGSENPTLDKMVVVAPVQAI